MQDGVDRAGAELLGDFLGGWQGGEEGAVAVWLRGVSAWAARFAGG